VFVSWYLQGHLLGRSDEIRGETSGRVDHLAGWIQTWDLPNSKC
jgi:hypothetical protein